MIDLVWLEQIPLLQGSFLLNGVFAVVVVWASWSRQQLKKANLRLRLEMEQHRLRSQQAEQYQLELNQALERIQHFQTEEAVLQERLAQEGRRVEEAKALLDAAEKKLSDSFKILSKEVLAQNSGHFLELAEQRFKQLQQQASHDLEQKQQAMATLVQPIGDSLAQVKKAVGEIEKARIDAYSSLKQQMDDLLRTHLPRLHSETANLVKALRQPTTRGRWGEVQLRRVVEMAGMIEHCDFDEQVSRQSQQGRLRPDLVVHLPGRRLVVVDAKAPVDAYLKAVEAGTDEEREQFLQHHANQLRRHIQQLSSKNYFDQFPQAPEFVVLFVPGEAFFSAALHTDPSLIEYGTERQVIPASPTTLIALLKAVAYGWQQEAMAQNAEEIISLGKELFDRIVKVTEHWGKVGDQLQKTVTAYNSASASLEGRLMSTARKFQGLKQDSGNSSLKPIEPIEKPVRGLQGNSK